MNQTVVAVICHPRSNSFNYHIANTLFADIKSHGHHLLVQDLYADGFDPVLTAEESIAVQKGEPVMSKDPLVVAYQQQLQQADVLLVIHPNWWGKPPAMMAGWLDRVLAPGVAYKLDGGAAGAPESLLKLKSLVITTGDTAPDREQQVFGDPLQYIWGNCILPYISSATYSRLHLAPVNGVDAVKRDAWVQDARAVLSQLLKG